ncbi:MAG: hypothetical protein MZU95_00170 [Desulfomicrobium escambiense]|nr:hypothetical protein [Desulfomicrobium escambiense]
MFRYRQAGRARSSSRILDGTYQPGEKLPSIRRLAPADELEHLDGVPGLPGARKLRALSKPGPNPATYVLPVSLQEAGSPGVQQEIIRSPAGRAWHRSINSVVEAISNPRFVPLGNTAMDPALLPVKPLARILKSLNHSRDADACSPTRPRKAFPDLQAPDRAADRWGCWRALQPEDIIITNGCMEAVALVAAGRHASRATPLPSKRRPTSAFCSCSRKLGLLVVEIATDPRDGVDLEELEKSLEREHYPGLPVHAQLSEPPRAR